MARAMIRRQPAPTVHPLDRFVQGLFRDPFFNAGLSGGLTINGTTLDEGALELDIAETDEAIVVHASVPGFKREDIAIDIHDGVLSITATLTEETDESDSEGESGTLRYHRRERRTGSVSRRVALPVAVNEEAAKATLVDGVLELTLPKDSGAGPRRIAIN